jgi:hypothetical protein
VKRDQLAVKLDETQNQAASGWDNFKKNVNDTFSQLEKDIDAAF